MSVNGNPKSLWTVEVLFPISVLANFLPVCVATTQVLACHCSNSSIMKKKCPDISRRRKGKICGISAKLCWLSSSWSLLTIPRQDTGCHTMEQWAEGALWLSSCLSIAGDEERDLSCWIQETRLWSPFYHHCMRKVLQHFWNLGHLKR